MRERQVTTRELAARHLARIADLDPRLDAVVLVDETGALAAAEADARGTGVGAPRGCSSRRR